LNSNLIIRKLLRVSILIEFKGVNKLPNIMRSYLSSRTTYNVDLLKSSWRCTHLLILNVSNYLVWRD